MTSSTFDDITGKVFGKLTVLKRVENKDNRPHFLCKCECLNEKVVSSKNLKSGHTTSCGCFRRDSKFKDLSGQVFGRLTVLFPNGLTERDKKTTFSCQCSCGTVKIVRGNDLVTKKIVSCGCYKNENIIIGIKK